MNTNITKKLGPPDKGRSRYSFYAWQMSYNHYTIGDISRNTFFVQTTYFCGSGLLRARTV